MTAQPVRNPYIARRYPRPAVIETTAKRDGDRVLPSWALPAYTHGDPIETRLPTHPDLMPVEQPSSWPKVVAALHRSGWEDWIAGLCVAFGVVVLVTVWGVVS